MQGQYYLRGAAKDYRFGDYIIVSGGPGAYLISGRNCTLSLFANVFYESSAVDEILGSPSTQTGMTAWYAGPQINLTVGNHFSAYTGADLPLHIYNHGLQTVPEWRIRAGLAWRF